jgi:hypothetical protein
LDWYLDFVDIVVTMLGGSFLFHLFWGLFFASAGTAQQVVYVENLDDRR